MGLDMYLTAKKYVSAYDFSPEDNKQLYKQAVLDYNVKDLVDPDTPSMEINFTVGYWRKANQIHGWFVNNIQNGVDDGGEYYVDPYKLDNLLDLCKTVLAQPEKASELLPPHQGLFFGSYDIDDWYFSDLHNTITILERVLKFKDYFDFYYHSFW